MHSDIVTYVTFQMEDSEKWAVTSFHFGNSY